MNSDFLDKFKGKASKVSKQGYHRLFKDAQKSKSISKVVKIKLPHGSKIETQNDKKKKKKKQKISLSNKQNKKHKNLNRSISEKKINKSIAKDQDRKVLVHKQNKKITDHHDSKNIKQTLKLPKIGKQNHLVKSASTKEKKQQPQIMKALKKNIVTQISDQKRQKNQKLQKNQKHQKIQKIQKVERHEKKHHKTHNYQDFLDQDVTNQLKKLNQFQNLIIQRKIQQSMVTQDIYNLNSSLHNSRKGVTVHY